MRGSARAAKGGRASGLTTQHARSPLRRWGACAAEDEVSDLAVSRALRLQFPRLTFQSWILGLALYPRRPRCAIVNAMDYVDRKSYAVERQADGTYAIMVRQNDFLVGVVPGFPTLDAALDERGRLDAFDCRSEGPSAIRPRRSNEQ